MDFITEHQLSFEVAPWITREFMQYRVGTCHGLWTSTEDTYDILAVLNDEPGNGHFNDVMQWFEHSCERDNKNLRFLETWNERLVTHLVNKRGFVRESTDVAIKHLKKSKTNETTRK